MDMTHAVIFDMDGVIIDSEFLWRESERECFAKVGIALSEIDFVDTMGTRIDETVEYRFQQHPWKGIPKEVVTQDIVDTVIKMIKERGHMLPGVGEAFACCRDMDLPIAIASSSSKRVIDVVLHTLGLQEYIDGIFSAQHVAQGKPAPDVYEYAAEGLGVKPENCIAIEDSPHGLSAAVAAGMKTVAVPNPFVKDRNAFAEANVVLDSLEQFDKTLIQKLFGMS